MRTIKYLDIVFTLESRNKGEYLHKKRYNNYQELKEGNFFKKLSVSLGDYITLMYLIYNLKNLIMKKTYRLLKIYIKIMKQRFKEILKMCFIG